MIKSQLLDGFEDLLKRGLTGLRNVTKIRHSKFLVQHIVSDLFPNLRRACLTRFLQNLKPIFVEFRNNIH